MAESLSGNQLSLIYRKPSDILVVKLYREDHAGPFTRWPWVSESGKKIDFLVLPEGKLFSILIRAADAFSATRRFGRVALGADTQFARS